MAGPNLSMGHDSEVVNIPRVLDSTPAAPHMPGLTYPSNLSEVAKLVPDSAREEESLLLPSSDECWAAVCAFPFHARSLSVVKQALVISGVRDAVEKPEL